MEVNKNNFYQELANILEAISYSDAVCIDLEMSGISTSTGEEKVKMSLGDVYAKAKAAAEAFTILQLGITCVSWDDQVSGYETTTYNIPLAPSIVGDDQVSKELANKMERQVTFSSQTINFLLTNHFDLDQVFERGVPYLSGAELGQLRMSRWVTDREVAYEDRINIQHLPMETQNFCRSIQHNIQEDITAKMFGEKRPKTLTLASPYGGRFSSLQKRLVNQVIDSHFCHHRASSKNGSMSMEVYPIDPRVDKNNGRILALRSQALMKLTGFGFVWNAIIGASFANKIDAEVIVGQDPEAIIALRQRLLACEARLRRKRPIIVGHNMLHDVCFLFQTFQGDLPATVREFQELVRSKLVTIVDTKYLFTRGDHEMMPDQSLEECFNVVRNEQGVSIRPKSDAFGYKTAMPHQAGYDSESLRLVALLLHFSPLLQPNHTNAHQLSIFNRLHDRYCLSQESLPTLQDPAGNGSHPSRGRPRGRS